MMKNKIIIFAGALLISVLGLEINAQKIILRQTVPEDFGDADNDYGPNRGSFNYSFIEYNFSASGYDHNNQNLGSLKTLRSFGITSGGRFLKNMGSFLSANIDSRLSYKQLVYDTEDLSAVQLPLTDEFMTSSKYYFVNFGLGAAFNFNLRPKRGNQLGRYIRLGAIGDYHIVKRFSGKYEQPLDPLSKVQTITLSKVNFINPFSFAFEAGYGRTSMYLFARYRYSDLINIDSVTEVPRLTFGIQFFAANI